MALVMAEVVSKVEKVIEFSYTIIKTFFIPTSYDVTLKKKHLLKGSMVNFDEMFSLICT